MSSSIQILNRRLGESLGHVCGGAKPRFSWLWAPDQIWLVYDRDDKTVIKKSWADMPAPDGKPLGKAWVMGEWRASTARDHHGFGEGVRVAVAREVGYAPYLETVLPPGIAPTDELTANYIRVIGDQMAKAEAPGELMAEEKFTAERNDRRDREAHREASAREYDKYTGAYGNLSPGQTDGWMSFGGTGDSPVVKRLQEAVAAE